MELHLDDSVDAKALLGSYVCGDRPGEFAWQPGPLAVAMAQGDWVLIEDLDKCPRELLAALRPVLEGQPLTVGLHRPPLVAAAGFKLFGTCTTAPVASLAEDTSTPLFSPSTSSEVGASVENALRVCPAAKPLAPNALFGLSRLFLQVPIAPLHAASGEVASVVHALFPSLPDTVLAPTLRSFDAVASLTGGNGNDGSSLRAFSGPTGGAARMPTVRDLLKVCRRLSESVFSDGGNTGGAFKVTSGIAARVVAEIVDVAVVGSADEAAMEAAARALGAVWQLLPESIVARCASHSPEIRHEALPASSAAAAAAVGREEAAPSAMLVVGRVRMPAQAMPSSESNNGSTFAHTAHALRAMERIAAACAANEPVLLVGETGGGKTTLVQELAKAIGRELLVQNMSLQTDAADLLGGYRPVDIRTLARPLLVRFLELFPKLFSRTANMKFLAAVAQLFERRSWPKLAAALQGATQRSFAKLKKLRAAASSSSNGDESGKAVDASASAADGLDSKEDGGGKRAKKAVTGEALVALSADWERFAEALHHFHARVKPAAPTSDSNDGDTTNQAPTAPPVAFAFQEGQLVRAVREGHWLLLDEVNLASAETLQRLSGLLEGHEGTLRVMERGDAAPLQRHPNFRLFATMNPPTDAGKKDLPASLRCRFTECFLHELVDPTDLLLVAGRYLGAFAQSETPISGGSAYDDVSASGSLSAAAAATAGLAYFDGGSNSGVVVPAGTSAAAAVAHSKAPPVLAAAAVDCYLNLRQLVESDALVDGANQKPRFSLRTFCRALAAARALGTGNGNDSNGASSSGGCGGFTARRALLEGFALGFETLLDQPSKLISRRALRRAFCESTTSTASLQGDGGGKKKKGKKGAAAAAAGGSDAPSELESDKPVRRPGGRSSGAEQWALVEPFWLKTGVLPLDDGALLDPKTGLRRFVLTPHVATTLRAVASAVAAGEGAPVLLQGPTSAGKTSMIEYLAARAGHKCVRVNNHEHTDIAEYLGSYTAKPPPPARASSEGDSSSGKGGSGAASEGESPLEWSDGVLVQALRAGDWIILDELNLAPSEVLEALNRLLDGNRELLVPETQEVVKPAPGFLLFATQNPPGSYGGRKPLSRAFRNRFVEIHVTDLPPPELETILTERSGLQPSLAGLVVKTMLELQLRRQRSGLFAGKHSFVTARDLLKWASRKPGSKEEAAAQGYFLLAERLRKDDERGEVQEVLEQTFGCSLDPESLYQAHRTRNHTLAAASSSNADRATTAPASADVAEAVAAGLDAVALTGSMARLLALVEECLRCKEPVLLVGDTGCGKTTVCQLLAMRRAQHLHVVNCHQNSEAADLLGSLRPLRGRPALRKQLRETVQAFLAAWPRMTLESGALLENEGVEGWEVPLPSELAAHASGAETVAVEELATVLAAACAHLKQYLGELAAAHPEVASSLARSTADATAAAESKAATVAEAERVSRVDALVASEAAAQPVVVPTRVGKRSQRAQERREKRKGKRQREGSQGGKGGEAGVEVADNGDGGKDHGEDSQGGDAKRVALEAEDDELMGRAEAGDETKGLDAGTDRSGEQVATESSASVAMALAINAALPNLHALAATAGALTRHAAQLFEWHDGPLVHAMQSGDMLLLDEISLAEDAVLERLNSVLEPSRTLTLAERAGAAASNHQDVAGADDDGTFADDGMTIVATEAFRVLATMNPGGDFGKRELSPALRSRFTEIWVPAVTDRRDVLAVIQASLAARMPVPSTILNAAAAAADSSAPPLPPPALRSSHAATLGFVEGGSLDGGCFKGLPEAMFEFAAWCSSQGGLGQPLSLRDLVAWAKFVVTMVAAEEATTSAAAVASPEGKFDGTAKPLPHKKRKAKKGEGRTVRSAADAEGTLVADANDATKARRELAWLHFGHGACLVVLDGIGMLGNATLHEDEAARLRAAAARRLLVTAPADMQPALEQVLLESQGAPFCRRMRPSPLQLDHGVSAASSVTEFGAPPFFVPCGTQLVLPSQVDDAMGVMSEEEGASADPFAFASEFSFDAPTTGKNARRLLRAMQLKKPVLLEGSPGVGKTSLVAALAAAAGQPLCRINLSDQSDLSDLMGSDLPVPADEEGGSDDDNDEGDDEMNEENDGENGVNSDQSVRGKRKKKKSKGGAAFAWQDGAFLRALKLGHWVLLDELNLAPQAVLEGLNACLDHRAEVFIPELGKTFKCPPTFRVFGAQNPLGQGGGRKGLPASFLNRFTRVAVAPLTSTDLSVILAAKFPALASARADGSTGLQGDEEPRVLLDDGAKMLQGSTNTAEAATEAVADAAFEASTGLLGRMVEFNRRVQSDIEAGLYGQLGRPWEFNLRDVFRWAELLIAEQCPNVGSGKELSHWEPRRVADSVYFHRLRSASDRKCMARAYVTVFEEASRLPGSEGQITEEVTKSSGAPAPVVSSGEAETPVDLVVTPDLVRIGHAVMLRRSLNAFAPPPPLPPPEWSLPRAFHAPLQDLARCVRHGWCGLLVGGPSTGKGSLVACLASLARAPLRVHALTPATDTAELLGGFEQADTKRMDGLLAQSLDQLFAALLHKCTAAPRTRALVGASVDEKLTAVVSEVPRLLELRWALRRRLVEVRASIKRQRLVSEDAATSADDEENTVNQSRAENTDVSFASLFAQGDSLNEPGLGEVLVPDQPATALVNEALTIAEATSEKDSSISTFGASPRTEACAAAAVRNAWRAVAKQVSESSGSQGGHASAGRFEWVDGILVQAMLKGEWLLLDNVNLCSSSVLDRLNSLLEPGGDLLLTECVGGSNSEDADSDHPSTSNQDDSSSDRVAQNTDSQHEGSADTATGAPGQASPPTVRRIVPASGFRLFVAMDPTFGEVSRAMRNRCVEICLLPSDWGSGGDDDVDNEAKSPEAMAIHGSIAKADAAEQLLGTLGAHVNTSLVAAAVATHAAVASDGATSGVATTRSLKQWSDLALGASRRGQGSPATALVAAFPSIYGVGSAENTATGMHLQSLTASSSSDYAAASARGSRVGSQMPAPVAFRALVEQSQVAVVQEAGRLLEWWASSAGSSAGECSDALALLQQKDPNNGLAILVGGVLQSSFGSGLTHNERAHFWDLAHASEDRESSADNVGRFSELAVAALVTVRAASLSGPAMESFRAWAEGLASAGAANEDDGDSDGDEPRNAAAWVTVMLNLLTSGTTAGRANATAFGTLLDAATQVTATSVDVVNEANSAELVPLLRSLPLMEPTGTPALSVAMAEVERFAQALDSGASSNGGASGISSEGASSGFMLRAAWSAWRCANGVAHVCVGRRLEALAEAINATAEAKEWAASLSSGSRRGSRRNKQSSTLASGVGAAPSTDEDRGVSWAVASEALHLTLLDRQALPHHPLLPLVAPLLVAISTFADCLVELLTESGDCSSSDSTLILLDFLLQRADLFAACLRDIPAVNTSGAPCVELGPHGAALLVHWRWLHKATTKVLTDPFIANLGASSSVGDESSPLGPAAEALAHVAARVSTCLAETVCGGDSSGGEGANHSSAVVMSSSSSGRGMDARRDVLWKRGGHPAVPRAARDHERLLSLHTAAHSLALSPAHATSSFSGASSDSDHACSGPLTISTLLAPSRAGGPHPLFLALAAPADLRRDVLHALCTLHWAYTDEMALAGSHTMSQVGQKNSARAQQVLGLAELGPKVEARVAALSGAVSGDLAAASINLVTRNDDDDDVEDGGNETFQDGNPMQSGDYSAQGTAGQGLTTLLFVHGKDKAGGGQEGDGSEDRASSVLWRWAEYQAAAPAEHWAAYEEARLLAAIAQAVAEIAMHVNSTKSYNNNEGDGSSGANSRLHAWAQRVCSFAPAVAAFIRTSLLRTLRSPAHLRPWQTLAWALDAFAAQDTAAALNRTVKPKALKAVDPKASKNGPAMSIAQLGALLQALLPTLNANAGRYLWHENGFADPTSVGAALVPSETPADGSSSASGSAYGNLWGNHSKRGKGTNDNGNDDDDESACFGVLAGPVRLLQPARSAWALRFVATLVGEGTSPEAPSGAKGLTNDDANDPNAKSSRVDGLTVHNLPLRLHQLRVAMSQLADLPVAPDGPHLRHQGAAHVLVHALACFKHTYSSNAWQLIEPVALFPLLQGHFQANPDGGSSSVAAWVECLEQPDVAAALASSSDGRLQSFATSLVLPAIVACARATTCSSSNSHHPSVADASSGRAQLALVGNAWCLVGLLTLHLAVPARPLDPASAPLVKRAAVLSNLQRTKTRLTLRRWANRLAAGHDRDCTMGHVAAEKDSDLKAGAAGQNGTVGESKGMLMEAETLATEARKLSLRAIQRPTPSSLARYREGKGSDTSADLMKEDGGDAHGASTPQGDESESRFRALHGQVTRFVNGLSSVARIQALRATLSEVASDQSSSAPRSKGVEVKRAMAQELAWQEAADSFAARLRDEFGEQGYADVCAPIEASLFHLKDGLRLLAAAAAAALVSEGESTSSTASLKNEQLGQPLWSLQRALIQRPSSNEGARVESVAHALLCFPDGHGSGAASLLADGAALAEASAIKSLVLKALPPGETFGGRRLSEAELRGQLLQAALARLELAIAVNSRCGVSSANSPRGGSVALLQQEVTTSSSLVRGAEMVMAKWAGAWRRAKDASYARQAARAEAYKYKTQVSGADTEVPQEEKDAAELLAAFPDFKETFTDLVPKHDALDAPGVATDIHGNPIANPYADNAQGSGDDDEALDVDEERDATWLCAVHARIYLSHHSGFMQDAPNKSSAGPPLDALRRGAFRFSYRAATSLAPAVDALLGSVPEWDGSDGSNVVGNGPSRSLDYVAAPAHMLAMATAAANLRGAAPSPAKHGRAAAGKGEDPDLLWLLGVYHSGGSDPDAVSSGVGGSEGDGLEGLGAVSSEAGHDKTLDFHRSPAVGEARLLNAPLEALLRRLALLLASFPAHPVLCLLARISDRLRQLPARAPLAHFVAGAELLLKQAQQWEALAARHVSLKVELATIGGLVVRWRKLELKSWQALLRGRERKHAARAHRTWFALHRLLVSGENGTNSGGAIEEYGEDKPEMSNDDSDDDVDKGVDVEASDRWASLNNEAPPWMVAAILGKNDAASRAAAAAAVANRNQDAEANTIDDDNDESKASKEAWRFYSSLDSYLKGCRLGEFPARLHLVRAFAAELAARASPAQAGSVTLARVVYALWRFYSLFLPDVRARMATGRAPLEAKLKEAVKLAKWDEQSYAALEESAEKNHKRLAKLMGEYEREVLHASCGDLVEHSMVSGVRELLSGNLFIDHANAGKASTEVPPHTLTFKHLDPDEGADGGADDDADLTLQGAGAGVLTSSKSGDNEKEGPDSTTTAAPVVVVPTRRRGSRRRRKRSKAVGHAAAPAMLVLPAFDKEATSNAHLLRSPALVLALSEKPAVQAAFERDASGHGRRLPKLYKRMRGLVGAALHKARAGGDADGGEEEDLDKELDLGCAAAVGAAVAEELCDAIFVRLKLLRKPGTAKEAKRRGLTDFLGAMKGEGLNHTAAAPPPALVGHGDEDSSTSANPGDAAKEDASSQTGVMAHLLAGAPLAAQALAVESSQGAPLLEAQGSSSAGVKSGNNGNCSDNLGSCFSLGWHPLRGEPSNYALWRRADEYFYRGLTESACLRAEANARCSPDVNLRERGLCLKYCERLGWLVLQQRAVLSALLNDFTLLQAAGKLLRAKADQMFTSDQFVVAQDDNGIAAAKQSQSIVACTEAVAQVRLLVSTVLRAGSSATVVAAEPSSSSGASTLPQASQGGVPKESALQSLDALAASLDNLGREASLRADSCAGPVSASQVDACAAAAVQCKKELWGDNGVLLSVVPPQAMQPVIGGLDALASFTAQLEANSEPSSSEGAGSKNSSGLAEGVESAVDCALVTVQAFVKAHGIASPGEEESNKSGAASEPPELVTVCRRALSQAAALRCGPLAEAVNGPNGLIAKLRAYRRGVSAAGTSPKKAPDEQVRAAVIAAAGDVGLLVGMAEVAAGAACAELVALNKSTAKLHYVALRVCRTLLAKGFCSDETKEGAEGDGEGPSCGKMEDDVEGTGMGEGDGKKDVSDELEDEEQILGLQGEEQKEEEAKKELTEEEMKSGLEMDNDFDGEMFDVPQDEKPPPEDDGDDSGEELEREFGDAGEGADVVDQKLWGDESEDDQDNDDDNKGEQLQGPEKFEAGSRLDGAPAEDEVRTKEDSETPPPSKGKDEKEDNAKNEEPAADKKAGDEDDDESGNEEANEVNDDLAENYEENTGVEVRKEEKDKGGGEEEGEEEGEDEGDKEGDGPDGKDGEGEKEGEGDKEGDKEGGLEGEDEGAMGGAQQQEHEDGGDETLPDDMNLDSESEDGDEKMGGDVGSDEEGEGGVEGDKTFGDTVEDDDDEDDKGADNEEDDEDSPVGQSGGANLDEQLGEDGEEDERNNEVDVEREQPSQNEHEGAVAEAGMGGDDERVGGGADDEGVARAGNEKGGRQDKKDAKAGTEAEAKDEDKADSTPDEDGSGGGGSEQQGGQGGDGGGGGTAQDDNNDDDGAAPAPPQFSGPEMPNPFRQPGDAAKHWHQRLDMAPQEAEEEEASPDGGGEENDAADQAGTEEGSSGGPKNTKYEFSSQGGEQVLSGASEEQHASVPQSKTRDRGGQAEQPQEEPAGAPGAPQDGAGGDEDNDSPENEDGGRNDETLKPREVPNSEGKSSRAGGHNEDDSDEDMEGSDPKHDSAAKQNDETHSRDQPTAGDEDAGEGGVTPGEAAQEDNDMADDKDDTLSPQETAKDSSTAAADDEEDNALDEDDDAEMQESAKGTDAKDAKKKSNKKPKRKVPETDPLDAVLPEDAFGQIGESKLAIGGEESDDDVDGMHGEDGEVEDFAEGLRELADAMVADEIDLHDDDDDDSDADSEARALTAKAQAAARLPALRARWARYCALTAPLAQQLCEQLRLVLEPQVASRLKGDYRSGKRLNMRRVIPYIASGYRKDKIWLRRTKPSKRNYHVLLAIDDSRTMRENGAGAGALAALATLSAGLTQLEVGQMAVLRFGDEVSVLHDFEAPPFGAEDGAKALEAFQFAGEATPARAMLEKSIGLFDAAEQANGGSDDGDASHQMMFVVSDGRYDQSQLQALRRLNRRLAERKRLLVLLIVDGDPSRSIEKERRILFEGNEIKNLAYLDDYPFPYYVVLKDIAKLPEVLSDALRQWFELLHQNQ